MLSCPQVPEDEIEAITDLPHLDNLKAKDAGDLKVLMPSQPTCLHGMGCLLHLCCRSMEISRQRSLISV